ncbi:hypothetical protein [Acinetobacter pittii]|nr:hypothetical protein [Acinetobacter pittii]
MRTDIYLLALPFPNLYRLCFLFRLPLAKRSHGCALPDTTQ